MHVVVPLCMMTWSNTLVTSVNVCVCFYFFFKSCDFFFLCVLCCLMFIDMFHKQMQLMLRLGRWNEYVCMYRRLVFFLLPGANVNYTLIHQWKLWCPLHVLKLHFLEVKIDRKVTRGTIVWLLKTPFTSKMNMYVIVIIALLWIEGCHTKKIPRIGI